MSGAVQAGPGESGGIRFDRVLGFTVASRNVRGRMVRLGPVLDTILTAHDYPPALRHVLAEALVLGALMGALLKSDDSQLTLQAQTESGAVDLLVCDYRAGELRGYARHDPAALARLGNNPGLEAMFGPGYLAITFDMGDTGQRYQGIVPLEGNSLAAACESYFRQSEQIPTMIRVAVRSTPGGCVAAGMLVQHLPESEEGGERLHVQMDHPDWEHVAALGGSIRHDELLDQDLTMEDLAWRLFHEEQEVRVSPGPDLVRGCRCTAEYYRSVLERFPEEERVHMRDDAGQISVDCAFCSRVFRIDL
ncbi:Hsp33 family molecular chaperone HslO [Novosphingobium bradum]|uniref:Hsp33 family molecular chaperone HslO n=1 Tax=Novosphingobium bradum TaxID=1737444 RepID=A0ABV7IRB1_9SPHN